MGEINVALIGEGFMGRTHSNAWGQVSKFFPPADADFEDAYQTQRVLEAALIAAEEKRPVNMDEVK